MFFVMELPWATIGESSEELWFQQSYWGLLIASGVNLLTSGVVILVGAYGFIKGRAFANGLGASVPRLLVLSAVSAAYGFYVLATFVFVACAC